MTQALFCKVSLVSRQVGDDVTVEVTATTGVAAAWGIHHYLKYGCNVHVSWNVRQLGELGSIL
jgi:hypothetical protein